MAASQNADKQLNRQQRKELVRRLWSRNPGLDVVHRNAAGIDVGNEDHYVAIAPTQDEVPVQGFIAKFGNRTDKVESPCLSQ